MAKRTMTAEEFKRTRPDRNAKGRAPNAPTGQPGALKGRSWVRRSPPEDRTADGIRFDSKAEMTRYLQLKRLKADDIIHGFLRQPVFDLAGATYRPDFLVWHRNHNMPGWVWAEDVKGTYCPPEILRRFRRNQKQVMALYGIQVDLVEVDT